MLDIKIIRENPEKIQEAVKKKRVDVDVNHILSIDTKYRELLAEVQKIQQERNAHSSNIHGKPTDEQMEKGREIKTRLEKQEAALNAVKEELDTWLMKLPNIPHESVPVGKDESENVEKRKWGEPTKLDFKPRDHIEIGQILDIIDTEKAAKITGARFAYLKGDAVLLELALIQFTFSILQNEETLKSIAEKLNLDIDPKPFVPVLPPVMIRPEVYTRMGRLDPDQEIERYHLERDDLYLIGSAEHTLGPLHMDETLQAHELPIRYVGFSTSFRREAGSYGKDTKGILRVHQFDKIEMETFTLPEDSFKEQDFIVGIQEYLMQQLQIPYRVMMICTGDMGGPDARQMDIEAWIPSQDKYRETHTSDLMTDYQSRRLNTRVKNGDKTEFVHMNDATAFAIGRTLIAILENYQQEDGSVVIPEVLRQYMGGREKIEPKK